MLNNVLIDFYRCPEEHARYVRDDTISSSPGHFSDGIGLFPVGEDARSSSTFPMADTLLEASELTQAVDHFPRLPFDPDQVVAYLRLERYAKNGHMTLFRRLGLRTANEAYYAVRPIMPVKIRKHLQRAYLMRRRSRPFPHWPVDSSVESILEKLLFVTMKAQGIKSYPFIWFWPNGASACTIMTHDVETAAGRDFCSRLMDIDDEHDIKASFQIVPERRYSVPETFLEDIRKRGFEVNVQDLNHDGQLFSSEEEFLKRARIINQHGRRYRALGFRSAVLYRQSEWFNALEFSYDMSIPNVAHMDPQPGGCCTLFPYFIGHILELPVTTMQDYTLFHILGQYSLELWKRQLTLIQNKHGLISHIVHPDYIIQGRAQRTYRDLLAYLSRLRSDKNLWITLPREVDAWWRARSQMRLVHDAGVWRIDGPQKERAVIAYAHLEEEGIRYTIGSSAESCARQAVI